LRNHDAERIERQNAKTTPHTRRPITIGRDKNALSGIFWTHLVVVVFVVVVG